MQHLYAQCKQMMEVTDEEVETYQKEKEQMEMSEDEEATDSIMNEIIQLQGNIDESKAKLNLE